MFPCEKCGSCCKSIVHINHFTDMAGGDGTCKFFNSSRKECRIYDQRPLYCRVDEGYKYFALQHSLDEYYHLNKLSCFKLRKVQGEISVDRAEIKNTLSKRFCEISNQGIILGSGIAHTLYDNSLSGTVASNAREKICQDKALSSEIIGVLDSSFSAKGKAGIAFTIDAMFCNAFENSDTCFFIKYEDIGNLNYDNSDDDNVLLEIYRNKSSSYYTLNHPAFSKKKIMWFLEEAKELYRGINNDELDWDKL